jgi:para-nitrobenzyl esterase
LMFPRDAEASGVRWATTLGAGSIEQLRKIPAEKLLAADGSWPADATGKVKGGGTSGTDAVLDGYVLPQAMYETFRAGKQNDVPILIGCNANEAGDMLFAPLSAAAYLESVKLQFGDMSARLLELYPAGSDAVTAHSQFALMRDSWFGWQMWTWARLQSMSGRHAVYFYNFSYAPAYPPGSPLAAMGPAHGFELGDVFAHRSQGASAKDDLVLHAISTYWTNFAKTGNPSGPDLAPWPAFTREHHVVMNLGDPMEASEPASDDLRGIAVLDAFYAQQRHTTLQQQ